MLQFAFKVDIAIVRKKQVDDDELRRYLLLQEGFANGCVATEETHLIYPNTCLHFEKDYGVKIKGIVVEANSRSKLAYSVLEKGGVGQRCVTLRVFSGPSSTGVIIRILT